MTLKEVMKELESYGNEGTKRIFLNHGAPEPIFGVKVQDLKKIQKKVKKDHKLSLELYDTKNGDAMYLAGLIADESKITKAQLKKWAKNAKWYYNFEYTVPWVAADSSHGYDLALEWIESDKESIAACGWATLSNLVIVKSDDQLDLKHFKKLLTRAKKEVHNAKNRVRYTMNNFIIAVGSYVESLSPRAIEVADAIGVVDVEMGGTACKVPLASTYIRKTTDKGGVRKKKKTARC